MRTPINRQELLLRVQAKLMEAQSLIVLSGEESDKSFGEAIIDVCLLSGEKLAEAGCVLDYNPYYQTRY